MEVYIETLTGSAFELKVSPLETIMSVKAKIQRLEGIPVSQQHLIWQSKELEDDCSLQDYKITDGATLKLVISMRGGPINTRRVPVEDPTWKEITEYMEANREEIWEKLPGGRQVTLLVFRDGDQINFFRVVDRGDGTVAPVADSLSASSIRSIYSDENLSVEQQRVKENNVTMQKMKSIRKQMEALTLKKKPKRRLTNSRLQTYTSSYHSKTRAAHPVFGITRSCRLPPVPGQRVPLASQMLPRTSSPPSTNHLARPREPPVFSVMSRQPSSTVPTDHREKRDARNDLPLRKSSVISLTASTLPSRDCSGLSDIRSLPQLHGDGVLRIETSCSSLDGDAVQSRWRQTSRPASVLDPGENLTHTDRGNTGMSNGALAVGMLSTPSDMPTRRQLRNPQSQYRARATLEDIEHLQQTLAKFDPRISVQTPSRSRVPTLPNNRTVLEGMGFLGRPLRHDDRLAVIDNLELCRPKSSPDAHMDKKYVNARDAISRMNRTAGENSNETGFKNGTKPVIGIPKRKLFVSDEPKIEEPSSASLKSKKIEKSSKEDEPYSSERSDNGATSVASNVISGDVSNSLSIDVYCVQNTPECQSMENSTITKLPPIRAVKKVPSPRCNVCNRKTGLATSYTCRCGKLFCATHRYAELHNCTYDYKTEGRRILEQENPLVVATKLPKI